eukprot:CAMPEP_0185597114 /NCGR_PEP_ID=MMETSP0434-20130131/81161_1 /TAXON_ID=626734 ORGANISM="Favella taraikaensis, Strain Fe Narragansett Bay" /NCGR_SAMPLE_ID=MMETSP0434 /ASSEMBLY_ACC=CAM_ASM_000379 /LENGTH=84 /DNA_ID=CAMNT_0028225751 /DNA_START=221 /DNA_END=472 /DNA_ORIENTATION=-
MTRKKKKKAVHKRSEEEVSDMEMADGAAEGSINLSKLSAEEAHIYKMSTPISVTNLMINHPMCLVLINFFILSVISLAAFSFGW